MNAELEEALNTAVEVAEDMLEASKRTLEWAARTSTHVSALHDAAARVVESEFKLITWLQLVAETSRRGVEMRQTIALEQLLMDQDDLARIKGRREVIAEYLVLTELP